MRQSNPGLLDAQTPRQLLAHIRSASAASSPGGAPRTSVYPKAPLRGKEVAAAAQALETEAQQHICETSLCVCAPPCLS